MRIHRGASQVAYRTLSRPLEDVEIAGGVEAEVVDIAVWAAVAESAVAGVPGVPVPAIALDAPAVADPAHLAGLADEGSCPRSSTTIDRGDATCTAVVIVPAADLRRLGPGHDHHDAEEQGDDQGDGDDSRLAPAPNNPCTNTTTPAHSRCTLGRGPCTIRRGAMIRLDIARPTRQAGAPTAPSGIGPGHPSGPRRTA